MLSNRSFTFEDNGTKTTKNTSRKETAQTDNLTRYAFFNLNLTIPITAKAISGKIEVGLNK